VSPRVKEPAVVRVVREFKAELLRGEEAHQFEMARRYLEVERSLQDKIAALTETVARLQAKGEEPSLGMLYRLERWRALERQMLDELASFNDWALKLIAQRQAELGQLGVTAATQALQASGLALGFEVLPAEAIGSMVGLAGDGSPLAALLAEAYPAVADAVSQSLVQGVALGINPREVARQASRSLAVGLDRAFLIARTEELRAFRTANQAQYLAAGVERYKRLATKDDRTCIGCLAADGELMATADDFEAHPACRCTSVPVVPGVSEPTWESTQAWFDRQDAATKAKVMGPGRLELYESGDATWGDMWTRRPDETWGGAIVPTNLSDLKAGGGTPLAQAA
jgi:SPP1 gp7 family putative phage head morphogenesis protein